MGLGRASRGAPVKLEGFGMPGTRMSRNGSRGLHKCLAGAVVALWVGAGSAHAQPNPADLAARLEAEEREIADLRALLKARGLKPAEDPATIDDKTVKRIVEGYIAGKAVEQTVAEAAAAEKLATEGFKVGSDLRLLARWDYFRGFFVETPNKDFALHVGARFDGDTVAFTQSPVLKAAPTAGMGDLEDGTFFRRVRVVMDGTLWQVFEFRFEPALEQTQNGIVTIDETYVGMKDIPILGTVRAGNMRLPQGLEGNQVSGSRAMTFMEASYDADAFFAQFAPGVLFTNSILDQHMTYTAMGYRQTQSGAVGQNDAADFGDGKFGATGRLTFLPIYRDDGVELLHLGVSGTWRKSENVDNAAGNLNDTNNFVDLRARPLLRDAQGAYGTTFDNGGNLLPGDANRMVDTGKLFSSSSSVAATELFFVCGPFSVQSEWAMMFVSDASPLAAGGGPTRGMNPQTRSFNGGYVELSYFLTGEHRTYDRRLGRLDFSYFTGPATNFWLTRDDNGGLNVGRGAWEIAARYDYLNLNDGPIRGGVVDGCEIALNWYLNPAVKIQFEYTDNNRYHLNPAGTPVGKTDGVVQGFGTRLQLNF